MVETRFIFSAGFESLFTAGLKARLTPALRDELRYAGVNVAKLDPAFPVGVWVKTLHIIARALYPELTYEEACLELGRQSIDGFVNTIGGKAALVAMRLIGIRRSLERAARSYAVTGNYMKVVLTQHAPTRYTAHMNEVDGPPEFDMGVMGRMLEVLGAKQSRVTLLGRDAEGFTLELEWSE